MRTQRLRAFTLVELLVVIGIIAILIAILLPVLQRVKEQANRVVCMSNHKQIMTAMQLYSNDWKGFLPQPNWGGQENRIPGWLYDPKTTPFDASPKNLDQLKSGALYKFLHSEKLYRCPFDPPPWNRGPVHPITSYGVNGSIGGYGRSPTPFFRLSQFKQDDILLWELDENYMGGANIFNDGSNYPPEGITRRHGSRAERSASTTVSNAGAIVSTASISVEYITVRVYYKEAADNGQRSRLWNVPKQVSANGH